MSIHNVNCLVARVIATRSAHLGNLYTRSHPPQKKIINLRWFPLVFFPPSSFLNVHQAKTQDPEAHEGQGKAQGHQHLRWSMKNSQQLKRCKDRHRRNILGVKIRRWWWWLPTCGIGQHPFFFGHGYRRYGTCKGRCKTHNESIWFIYIYVYIYMYIYIYIYVYIYICICIYIYIIYIYILYKVSASSSRGPSILLSALLQP